MRSAPDLVAMNSALGTRQPRWPTGRALSADPSFTSRYRLLVFAAEDDGRDVHGWYWVRRDGGPLGIARRPDELVVPGWFLATTGREAARLLDGRLVGNARGEGGVIDAVTLDPGCWAVELDPPGPSASLRPTGSTETTNHLRVRRRQTVDLVVRGVGPVERLVVSRCR
ncbi:MAG: hypothetical protein KC621_28390 [Myxococcales bacterium]|nr:hypothetical protein [Myxococcales bacterium]